MYVRINTIGEKESIVMLDCFFRNVNVRTGRAETEHIVEGEVGSVNSNIKFLVIIKKNILNRSVIPQF